MNTHPKGENISLVETAEKEVEKKVVRQKPFSHMETVEMWKSVTKLSLQNKYDIGQYELGGTATSYRLINTSNVLTSLQSPASVKIIAAQKSFTNTSILTENSLSAIYSNQFTNS